MTEKVFLYAEVNLPPIPNELLKLSDSLTTVKDLSDIGYGVNHVKNGEELLSSGYSVYTSADSALLSWLKENRIPTFNKANQVRIQEQTAGTHIVHSDINRVYALNYIISTGGDNVLTSWYQEKNQPLRRTKTEGWKQADTGVVEYNDLELLGSVKCEVNKWYLIATDILHDVAPITETRMSISIGFTNNVAEVFRKLNLLIQEN